MKVSNLSKVVQDGHSHKSRQYILPEGNVWEQAEWAPNGIEADWISRAIVLVNIQYSVGSNGNSLL